MCLAGGDIINDKVKKIHKWKEIIIKIEIKYEIITNYIFELYIIKLKLKQKILAKSNLNYILNRLVHKTIKVKWFLFNSTETINIWHSLMKINITWSHMMLQKIVHSSSLWPNTGWYHAMSRMISSFELIAFRPLIPSIPTTGINIISTVITWGFQQGVCIYILNSLFTQNS